MWEKKKKMVWDEQADEKQNSVAAKTREALKMDGKWTKCKKISIIAIITRMQKPPPNDDDGIKRMRLIVWYWCPSYY